MIFCRYLGLIAANKCDFPKSYQSRLLLDYIFLKTLNLLPYFIKKNIHKVSFLKHDLSFFDLSTTTSLIEAIFIENEYYFDTKLRKPTIFDLGSNIGLSIIYFKNLYPHGKIIGFEADPTTFKTLEENVKSFKLKNTSLYNLAVSDKKGSLDFYIDKNGPGSPLMSTNPLRLSNNKINIKSDKLSNYINDGIDFVKMDIEGSEAVVIFEIDKAKKINKIDQISIEYHHHINVEDDVMSELLSILEKNNFGYQIHASQNSPFKIRTFEDIQIHAYKKQLLDI